MCSDKSKPNIIYDDLFLELELYYAESRAEYLCNNSTLRPEDLFSFFMYKAEKILNLKPFCINRDWAIEQAYNAPTKTAFFEILIEYAMNWHKNATILYTCQKKQRNQS